MTDQPEIREFMPGDLEGTADLLIEMQAHYRVHCPPRSDIVAGLRSRPAGTRLLLAVQGDAVLGLESFSAIYPGPGLTPGFFLKDLFVSQTRRGSGLGRRLMSRLTEIARSEGIGRIDWTADADDERMKEFYRALGGSALPEKLFFRIKEDELWELAGG